MTKEDTTIRRKIRLIEKHITELRKLTPTDEELADSVGHIRSAEVALAEIRHRYERLVSEMEPKREWSPQRRVNPAERSGPPQVEGKDFALVKQFKNVYTFNTPAIIVGITEVLDLGDTEATPTDGLMEAIAAGAATLGWKITKLQQLADLYGIKLRFSDEEVSDHDGLDEAMVGKVRVSAGVKRVALKPEE